MSAAALSGCPHAQALRAGTSLPFSILHLKALLRDLAAQLGASSRCVPRPEQGRRAKLWHRRCVPGTKSWERISVFLPLCGRETRPHGRAQGPCTSSHGDFKGKPTEKREPTPLSYNRTPTDDGVPKSSPNTEPRQSPRPREQDLTPPQAAPGGGSRPRRPSPPLLRR